MKNIPAYLLLSFLLTSVASGQTEKQFLPSEAKQQTVITEPPTLYKGFFKAGLTYSWTSVAKWFDASGKKVSVPGSGYYMTRSVSTDLRYGITNRITVHTSVPYMFYRMYQSVEHRDNLHDLVSTTEWDRKGYGVGDMDFGADIQLMTETATTPAVTLKNFITIPTGRKNPEDSVSAYVYKEPTGSGALNYTGILQARKVVYPLYYDISLYYTYYAHGEKMLALGEPETGFKSGNLFQAAGTIGYQVNDWICLNNMVSYNNKASDQYDNPSYSYLGYKSYSLDYYFYLYFQIKRLRLVQSVFVSMLGKNWGADPGYFIMMSYAF